MKKVVDKDVKNVYYVYQSKQYKNRGGTNGKIIWSENPGLQEIQEDEPGGTCEAEQS